MMSIDESKTKEYSVFQDYIDGLKILPPDDTPLTGLRRRALERFESVGLPHRKTESWKYVNLLPALKQPYTDPVKIDLAAVHLSELNSYGEDAMRIVFVDGQFAVSLSTVFDCEDMTIGRLDKALTESNGLSGQMAAEIEAENNPFALLNSVAFKEGTFIRIHENSRIEKPIHIYYVNQNPQAVFSTRTWLTVEENAQADIMCTYLSHGNCRAFSNDLCSIELKDRARINWINVQNLDGASTFISSSRVYLGKDARFERIGFSSGGNIIRNDDRFELLGENAYCSLNGLSILAGHSQVFNKVIANHRSPKCISRQFYKNILAGKSTAEFNSLAYVFKGAQKSDSGQLNKNLLLSDTAQVYSRPKLMIYADDVIANHGSATGQAEEQELFYLRSRGLDAEFAQYLLAFGFAEEILEQIHIPEVRRQLEEYVTGELKEMMPQGS